MDVQDLYNDILKLVEAELSAIEASTSANYVKMRDNILAHMRQLWDIAGVAPYKDADIGNMAYVSKAEAFKYGRFDSLTATVKQEARMAALVDVRNLEVGGVNIYSTQYDGYAWAYQQGYGLPITGGVKIRLVADALYSDFYGATFEATIKKNLGKLAQDIIDMLTRELNQGHSYTVAAQQLKDLMNRGFNSAVRVARTEGGRIQSQAYLDSLKLLTEVGVPFEKMWLSTIDNLTRESHIEMDGELADKDGVFHLPSGASGPAPRMTGSAKEDIQCRCSNSTIIDGVKPTERRVRDEGLVPFETFKERLARGGTVPITAVRKLKAA